MAYGENHKITYETDFKERWLWNFSARELLWIALGIFLGYLLFQVFPALPIDHVVFERTHLVLPLLVCLLCGYFQNPKTNLTLAKDLFVKFQLRQRQRAFYSFRPFPKKEEEK